jgi:hypothetical protein
MTIKTQDRVISYIQSDGRGNPLEAMSIDRHGLGDQTDNTIPGRGVLFGRDEFGRPVSKVEFDEAPGGLNTATISFDPEANLDFLDVMRQENGKFGIWKFFIPTGRLGNYANWTNNGSLDFLAGCKITSGVKGGREKDYAGTPLTNTYDISWRNTLTILPPKLTDSSPTSAVDPNNIAGVSFISDLDPQQEIPGYPGPDKIGYIASAGATGTSINKVSYTITGGGAWANLASDPFAAAEDLGSVAVRFISHDTYRVVVLRTTANAGQAPRTAYTDIVLGSEGGSITWTTADMGTTNNVAGETMFWGGQFGRLYASADTGKIYVSTNQAESYTLAADLGVALTQFAVDWDDNIWAVGATNTIAREKSSSRGTFDTLVGPTGGSGFTAVAVARDGYLYAGNGTAIYLSNNLAANTGGWSSLKDFGTNHSVVGIQCVDGESQVLRALVSDSTGTDGDVWYSLDGGNSWVEVTNLANNNYNTWYVSEVDSNLLFIGGDANGGAGVVHKLSPA